jgi:hypothetical protein
MMIRSSLYGVLSALVITGLLAGTLERPALADAIERGRIVRIEDREIYYDISAKNGVSRGDAVRLKRPIQLKHPITGKMVSDWLPLGTTTVTMVGSTMSMSVLDQELLARIQVGDLVEALVLTPLEPAPSQPPDQPVDQPIDPDEPARQPLPQIDAHIRAVLAVWKATSGQRVEVRIGAWEDFLAKNPDSPYAAAIHEDLEVLRAHRDKLRPAELDLDESFTGGLEHRPPTRARPDEAVDLVFLIDTPELAAAWLHYRVRGTSSYSKGVLRREDREYLRGQIPASAVQGPGVEYFVEIATPRGQVGTAVGTPDRPVVVDVPEAALTKKFTERKNRSRVSIQTAYLDFATFEDREGDRTDGFFMVEADFLYRLRGTLYGIRTGFGVLNGSGGYADRVYTEIAPAPKAGFNYGYAELELRGKYKTALAGRLVTGVGREGFGLGVEGRFRLGDEDQTNLSVGASTLQQVGFLTDIRMQWSAMKDFPLGLAVALTYRPNRGDLGVRLTTDIGYRALSWVQPTLRISYQARTVVHSGVGAGLGLVFDW